MKTLIFFLFLAPCFIGCKETEKLSFTELELSGCMGETKTFILPSGYLNTSTYSIDHGFIESVHYPDSSIISILCAYSSDLEFSKLYGDNRNSRKERAMGRTIMYENVTEERKLEFDKAFDKMID